MTNPFLNSYEQITYSKIKAITDLVDAHVFSKVRLADVLPINNSGISDLDFKFALQSHVDFLVTDSKYSPLFSVEFDGPTHKIKKQIERDIKKNRLLKHFGHPYIRIDSRYLDKKYRGLDLLTYFIDVWFAWESFEKAQAAGKIPYDEIFDPGLIVSGGISSGRSWPYWLSIGCQNKIQKWHAEDKVIQPCCSHWIGRDADDNLKGISWIFINQHNGIYVKTEMQEQNFSGVCCWDLLSQIAIFEVYENLEEVFESKRKMISSKEIEANIKEYEKSYKACSVLSCTTGIKDLISNGRF